MTVRTTATEVKDVITTSLTDVQVDTFISTANVMVNAHLSGSGLGEGLLTEIEKYITAHLIAMTKDQKPMEVEIDGVKEKYQGKTGMNLQATFFGQIAVALDSTGKLSMVGKGRTSIKAIDLNLD